MDKKYNANDLYFGNVMFNTDDGFWNTATTVVEKQGENKYKPFDKNCILHKYYANTKDYLSITNLMNLADVFPQYRNRIIKEKVLKLLLIKYRLKNAMQQTKIKNKGIEPTIKVSTYPKKK